MIEDTGVLGGGGGVFPQIKLLTRRHSGKEKMKKLPNLKTPPQCSSVENGGKRAIKNRHARAHSHTHTNIHTPRNFVVSFSFTLSLSLALASPPSSSLSQSPQAHTHTPRHSEVPISHCYEARKNNAGPGFPTARRSKDCLGNFLSSLCGTNTSGTKLVLQIDTGAPGPNLEKGR